MSDTDTLANLIHLIEQWFKGHGQAFDADDLAAVVAESGWLREARAEAWDEGVLHCEPDGLNQDPNPYRTTEDTDNTTDRT